MYCLYRNKLPILEYAILSVPKGHRQPKTIQHNDHFLWSLIIHNTVTMGANLVVLYKHNNIFTSIKSVINPQVDTCKLIGWYMDMRWRHQWSYWSVALDKGPVSAGASLWWITSPSARSLHFNVKVITTSICQWMGSAVQGLFRCWLRGREGSNWRWMCLWYTVYYALCMNMWQDCIPVKNMSKQLSSLIRIATTIKRNNTVIFKTCLLYLCVYI